MKKLTGPQRDALRAVGYGQIYGKWPFGAGRMQWMHRDHWQAQRPQPFEALRAAALISVAPAREHRSLIALTDSGHDALKEDR